MSVGEEAGKAREEADRKRESRQREETRDKSMRGREIERGGRGANKLDSN